MLALATAVAWLNLRNEEPIVTFTVPNNGTPEQIERGAYLARAGNCAGCHTERGGSPYAGGRGIATPFGSVYSGNLTPDISTGIGSWSAAQFWRALHHGRSASGRLLYPAFPYPDYTRVTREDSDALYAYLRSLPAVQRANTAQQLRRPFNTQAALAFWRALFFKAAVFEADATQSAEWNRGAYLVRGLGHCAACHGGRNWLGATPGGGAALAGGLIPQQNWYAPSLSSSQEAGVASWPLEDIVALLQTGTSARGTTLGPMAEVVLRSTQHLRAADLRAVAVYLKALPQAPAPAAAHAADAAAVPAKVQAPAAPSAGAKLYEAHCANCHGASGEGAHDATGKRLYSPLAGNRVVTLDPPANLVRIIVRGGFAPATAGNPRPFGMPPFANLLSDEEVAAVATHLRQAFGPHAPPVTALEVGRYRGGE